MGKREYNEVYKANFAENYSQYITSLSHNFLPQVNRSRNKHCIGMEFQQPRYKIFNVFAKLPYE